MITLLMIVVAATLRMLAPYLPGNRRERLTSAGGPAGSPALTAPVGRVLLALRIAPLVIARLQIPSHPLRRGLLRVRWLAVWSCLVGRPGVRRRRLRRRRQWRRRRRRQAGGDTLTIYSSLPLQGDSRPQSEDVVSGEKLALEAGRRQGRQLHDQVRVARRRRPPRPASGSRASSANARKAAQDDTTIAYLGEFNSGASAISIPILNEAGHPADLARPTPTSA